MRIPSHVRCLMFAGFLVVGLSISTAAPASPSSPSETSSPIVVAADGSGSFTTLQAAIAAAPSDAHAPIVIHLKPGLYRGQIIVPRDKPFLHLVGDDPRNTVVTYDHNVREPDSGVLRPYQGIGVVVLADNFSAENITFQNTSGDHGQALAFRADGDRESFRNCRFLGWQDTMMLNNGRDYLRDCYVEGRVDFIYGSATAVFDRCEIHSKNGGHITAASTPQDHPFGFVFLRCRLTGDPTPWNPADAKRSRRPLADLGRPWRPYAHVAYIHCEMGDHIKPDGWNNWGKTANEKTARYVEYGSTGPGANPHARVPWSRQLTDAEAATYTVAGILGGNDAWSPSTP